MPLGDGTYKTAFGGRVKSMNNDVETMVQADFSSGSNDDLLSTSQDFSQNRYNIKAYSWCSIALMEKKMSSAWFIVSKTDDVILIYFNSGWMSLLLRYEILALDNSNWKISFIGIM